MKVYKIYLMNLQYQLEKNRKCIKLVEIILRLGNNFKWPVNILALTIKN